MSSSTASRQRGSATAPTAAWIVRGSSNVFINGKPMARTGDVTSGC